MPHKALDRIRSLIRQINDWSHAYYVADDPKVPDREYDEAMIELKRLEAEHPELQQPDSPTQRVGQAAKKGFTKHRHMVPMLSLANAYSAEDLRAFFDRAHRYLKRPESNFEVIVEEKMDGLAMSLTYENGLLTIGATRGDGEVGEDVTENVRTVNEIPLRLRDDVKVPAKIEVRGEVYMNHAGFKKLNDRLTAAEQKVFANPRNAAAGSIRLLDSKLTAERPLHFFAYQLVGLELDQAQTLSTLEKLGFRVNPNYRRLSQLEEILTLIETYEARRKAGAGDYDIDGLVIKVNDRKLVNELGAIANSPRSAVAYKLSPMEALTVVEAIEVQVGRTGVLTPVAHLKEVFLSGVMVTRATLHNEEQIRVKDVRVGDTVWVRRAGDVIPEILRVDLSRRPPKSKPYEMPTECPACRTPVAREKSYVVCPNFHCPAKTAERLKHFCSRHAMDIRGLGDQIIVRLYELGYLKKVPDIYRLRERHDELITLEGLGEKSIDKILAAVEGSKKQSAARLLFALGLDLIGEKTAEDLLNATGSILKLLSMSEDELLAIHEVGPETAASVVVAGQDKSLRDDLKELKKLGVEGATQEVEVVTSGAAPAGPLSGLTFVITGTLSQPRDHFRDLLKANGAAVTNAISKSTDYLLAGQDAGSKLKKAEKLEVKVISERELAALIKDFD